MEKPSLSYIARDAIFTTVLVLGVFLLMTVEPEKSAEQKEVILQGTLNEMGGAEFIPQGNPRKPYTYIDVVRATDGGFDLNFRFSNLIIGETAPDENKEHLAVGYPYLLVDGIKKGRIYGDKYHLPRLPDGEHIISVYYEFPQGGLYRVLNRAIGNNMRLTVDGEDFETSTL